MTPDRNGDRDAPPLLSVVTPAFNQGQEIADATVEIIRRLDEVGLDFELIVVSDGSRDETPEAAATIPDPRVRVMSYDRNLGKGYALRTGSLRARGDWIAWIDSDLDLDPRHLRGFLDLARAEDLDVVIGSKRHPDSVVDYPARRRVYSRCFQVLVRTLFDLDVRDTQVGMKLFRRAALDEVLPVVLVKRYAFDVEILAVARRFGFGAIAEHPIELRYRFSGSGIDWRAAANALWDTAAVFYRLRLVHYYDKRRVLAHRVAVHRRDAPEGLGVVVNAPGLDARGVPELDARLSGLPPDTPVVVVTDGPAPAGATWSRPVRVVAAPASQRHDRIERALGLIDRDVVGIIDGWTRPKAGWAQAALDLLGDRTVGAVVGPVVPVLGGSPRTVSGGVLSESRLGVGSARRRAHVGALKEVGDFPASNLVARTELLRRMLRGGARIDDQLCARIVSRTGRSVISSPDVVVTAEPLPLYRPYLRQVFRHGVRSGARLFRGSRPRMRHVAPLALLGAAALTPAALTGPRGLRLAWSAAAALYLAALTGLAGITFLLHRRVVVTRHVVAGAAASHAVFGLGLLWGLLGRGSAAAREREGTATIVRTGAEAPPTTRPNRGARVQA